MSSWTNADLKIIQDHNLIYNLPPKCKLEQAAAQEKNGNNIEIYKNPSKTNKLSSGQKKILRVHEVFYILVRRHLGANSKPVRKFLEKILLKEISDEERDRGIKNLIAEIKSTGRKYICQATGYTPLFEGSSKFYKKNTKQLIFYGQTIEEAFHKLLDAQTINGYIPCNVVGTNGNAITGICLKPLTLGENCK